MHLERLGLDNLPGKTAQQSLNPSEGSPSQLVAGTAQAPVLNSSKQSIRSNGSKRSKNQKTKKADISLED